MIPSTLFCDACGAANKSQASFCRTCGNPLQAAGAASRNTATGRLLTGHLLKQRYCILDTIGYGGMGAVYKAEDTQLGNRKVAIKEMSQSGLGPQEITEAAEAFKQEAHILAGLQHPNLPNIYDHFFEAGRWYLVMSFIQGETLEDYLKKASGRKLPQEEALQIGIQLCAVLSYLHTQQPPIIFRDLKPSNIMRTPDGHLYLIDFGIARHFKPGQAKDTAYYGSMGYAPPEQYGRAQTTPRSDIYSLGAVLYQLISGHDPASSPFRFPQLQTLVPSTQPDLVTLLAQMLELDEDNRPSSILSIKQKLQNIAASVISTASPVAPTIIGSGSNQPVAVAPTQFAVTPIPPVAPTQLAVTPAPLTAPAQFAMATTSSAGSGRKKHKAIPILVIIAALVISVPVLVAVLTYTRGREPGAATSAQAQQPAHGTAPASAQTPNEQATIIADNPDPYQPTGTLALVDPLSSPYAWNSENQCQDTNGAYQISDDQTVKSFHFCPDSDTYGNFAFEVKMTINQGDCGGLAIRDSNSGFYFFQVCQDGSYALYSIPGSTLTSGTSSAINQGVGQTNVIATVADGSRFDLYVNNTLIDSATDSAYSEGLIGLVANSNSNETVVSYQDARVWTLSS